MPMVKTAVMPGCARGWPEGNAPLPAGCGAGCRVCRFVRDGTFPWQTPRRKPHPPLRLPSRKGIVKAGDIAFCVAGTKMDMIRENGRPCRILRPEFAIVARNVRGINKGRAEFLRRPLDHSTCLFSPAFSGGGAVCRLRIKNHSWRKELTAEHVGVIRIPVNGIGPDKIYPLLPFHKKAHHLTPGGHNLVPITRGIRQLAVQQDRRPRRTTETDAPVAGNDDRVHAFVAAHRHKFLKNTFIFSRLQKRSRIGRTVSSMHRNNSARASPVPCAQLQGTGKILLGQTVTRQQGSFPPDLSPNLFPGKGCFPGCCSQPVAFDIICGRISADIRQRRASRQQRPGTRRGYGKTGCGKTPAPWARQRDDRPVPKITYEHFPGIVMSFAARTPNTAAMSQKKSVTASWRSAPAPASAMHGMPVRALAKPLWNCPP